MVELAYTRDLKSLSKNAYGFDSRRRHHRPFRAATSFKPSPGAIPGRALSFQHSTSSSRRLIHNSGNITGISAVGSARDLGSRGREFESPISDHTASNNMSSAAVFIKSYLSFLGRPDLSVEVFTCYLTGH